jgi:hypothetical protein
VIGCGVRRIDCVHDGIWPGVPKPNEGRRIGDQIDAAFIFARADFVEVLWAGHFDGMGELLLRFLLGDLRCTQSVTGWPPAGKL